LLGGDPQALFNSQQTQLSQSAQTDNQSPHDEASKFVAVVLADTEDAWHAIFRQMGREYQEPKLVLFTDQIRSGCGFAGGFRTARPLVPARLRNRRSQPGIHL